MFRLQMGNGQEGSVSIYPLDIGTRLEIGRHQRGTILKPLELNGNVTFRHRAHASQSLASGQVLGEGERLHDGCDFEEKEGCNQCV